MFRTSGWSSCQPPNHCQARPQQAVADLPFPIRSCEENPVKAAKQEAAWPTLAQQKELTKKESTNRLD